MRALVALASPTHDDESVGLCIQVLIQVSPVKRSPGFGKRKRRLAILLHLVSVESLP
jgi:hypothetical protein